MNKFKHPAPVFAIPELEYDKMMAKRYGTRILPHGRCERRIVYNLVRYLEANGWRVVSVYDGEELTATANVIEVMELCFNLDAVSLRCRPATDSQALNQRTDYTDHGILLIFGNGNNGLDLISDYSCNESDNFSDIMEEFDTEIYA